MIHRVSRRNLLRGLTQGAAASAVLLPFMRLLSGQPVKAQALAPKRLVIFATPNGTVMNDWWPGSGCSTFGPILEPLSGFQSKLSVLRGLDMKSAYTAPVPKDHLPDFSNLLTGIQPSGQDYGQMSMRGISIDQAIANAIGEATKFKSLNLGNNTRDPSYPMLATGPDAMFLPENSPYNSYERLFSDLMMEPMTVDRRLIERRSVLDAITQDVTKVRCALGMDDRQRLDKHLESLRELERSLEFDGGNGVACMAPTLEDGSIDVYDNASFPAVGKMQMDIIAAALACDLTRVVTLQWSNGASQTHHTWVDVDFTHHGVSHGSEGVTADEGTRVGWLVKIENWYAQQFAYLLQKLDETEDADGNSVLHNSAVVWVHEQSNGGSHDRTDMPFVLAGTAAGYLGTGQCIDFNGRAHNDLLITLANAMDVPMTEFGDGNAGGAIEELRA